MTRSAPDRNAPCPCGSGRKYKRCCLGKSDAPAARRPAGGAPAPTPKALLAAAIEHHQAGRLAPAEKLYREVLARRARDAVALSNLGQLRADLGFHEEAIELTRRAVAIDGRSSTNRMHLADLCHRVGRYEEGIESGKRAMALDPHSAPACTITAICYERLNRLDEAQATIRKALALTPRDVNANLVLAQIQRRRGDLDTARAGLEALVARRGIDPWFHQLALQELGQVLDRLGAYDEAWDAFTRSGLEQRADQRAKRIDAGLWSRRIERYRAGMSPDVIRRVADLAPRDDERGAPVFLVGFSRSGTTMMEQVLAACDEVVTTDEEPLLRRMKDALYARRPGVDPEDGPALLAALDAEDVRALRASYWDDAEAFVRAPLAGRVFVDKLPLNLIDAGLINAIFPDARMIVALRDPRDVCVSCFFQWFQLQAANVRLLTIEDTVAFYAEVMAWWLMLRPMLDLAFIEVRYEDTVHDLEREARRMLELLGLPWRDDVLAFHERARTRAISTPSAAAVGERIHTRAVARWRHYERHLEGVAPVLRPFVEAFGYDDSSAGA